ncbi:DUF6894 family protein [Methylobacterium komagatae]
MPRYFIDTDDGHLFCQDENGGDFADVGDAETLALRALSEIARDTGPRGTPGSLCARVRDEAGAVLATATLRLTVERHRR